MPFLLSFIIYLIFGLAFTYYFSLFAVAQGSAVTCPDCFKNNFSCHGHCVESQGGVHGLDCFGYRSKRITWTCVWKPGKQDTSSSKYKLYIQQNQKCRVFAGISGGSQIITNDLFKNRNLTAYVVEENDIGICTKAAFTGFPHNLVRCGPPTAVHFNRFSRQLDVNVSWRQEEKHKSGIKKFSVRYWTLDTQAAEKFTVLSRDVERCTVGDLNPSLYYGVQIQCVTSESEQCRQCPSSKVFTVPPELTVIPVMEKIEEIPQSNGRRLLVIKWKFAEAWFAEGYRVTVEKVSGETSRQINTTRPEIRLIFSHSAYHLSISAFHSSATSPALERTIAPLVDNDRAPGRLNVTFSGNSSFVISWQYDLIKSYNCFSVEWWRKGGKPAHKSFFEAENNYEVITLEEPLQPYKRYTFTLHTRSDNISCNLKRVNNSESTYGSIEAYFTEGRPISAPGNISSSKETQSSTLIEWSPIPEEDTRGFLLGYLIHYTKNHLAGANTEINITVDAESNSFELVDLDSNTVYQVQMAAFTKAGVGVRGSTVYFETKPQESFTLGGFLTGLVVLIILLMLVVYLLPHLIKRVKNVCWPSMPNPRKSNAIQSMKGVCELELLEPMKTQKLKEGEGDSNSLHIIEKVVDKSKMSILYSGFDSNRHCNQEPADANETTSLSDTVSELLPAGPRHVDGCHRDIPFTTSEREDADTTSDHATPPSTDTQQTDTVPVQTVNHQSHPVVLMSDYTTMEFFQQAIPLRSPPASTSADSQIQQVTEDRDLTSTRPKLDYMRQSLSQGYPVLPS